MAVRVRAAGTNKKDRIMTIEDIHDFKRMLKHMSICGINFLEDDKVKLAFLRKSGKKNKTCIGSAIVSSDSVVQEIHFFKGTYSRENFFRICAVLLNKDYIIEKKVPLYYSIKSCRVDPDTHKLVTYKRYEKIEEEN